jgi:Zn-dependent protease
MTIGLTIHEFAHAYAADRAGDPTPRENGRVSLNPLDHFDPIGTVMILIAGLGWAKPVPVNPFRFKRPRWDDLMVSLWGPLSNVLVAVFFAVLLRYVLPRNLHEAHQMMFVVIIHLNLVLAFFNLLPIYPLDGSHILSTLLPPQSARRLDDFYARWGVVLLVVLLVTGAAWFVIRIPVEVAMRFLLG